ncbi:predicted protein [Sparassis crispa]|uniref:Transmembrane protein n=1 Tax=Sparassis crispa TaxID=139825 RepID=A0A401GTF3_9APHY|nr:predicted protein [Sparassis crispa]GBE85024.1 predicted protein [Sparassis crispa]
MHEDRGSLYFCSQQIVLLGENVDIDVDEPSVGLRWSIVACGTDFVLPGSEGIHESSSCGLPNIPLDIFVDSDVDPAAKYDPAQFPVVNGTGQRLSVQALFQFGRDHVLDVHEDYLYPFDTYRLTTTLRATSAGSNNTGDPIAISTLTTITKTSSFVVQPEDINSYALASDGSHVPSQDLNLLIQRPGVARAITMLLFSVNWMLAHSTIGFVAVSWLSSDGEKIRRYLTFIFVIVLAIPEIRKTMPDAPGFDGVLLDSIGFFPQMLITGMSAIVLLCMIAKRELELSFEPRPSSELPHRKPRVSMHFSKEVRNLRRGGTSVDFREARSWT